LVGAGVSTCGINVGNTVGVANDTASEAGVGVEPLITRPPQALNNTIALLRKIKPRHPRRCFGCECAFIEC
jgi:hypothetical protein